MEIIEFDDHYQWQGGTLPLGSKTYVERESDSNLYLFCVKIHEANRICFILAARQMGKSSLMVAVGNKLKEQNIKSVFINLQSMGGGNAVNSARVLWLSLLVQICKSLDNSEYLLSKLEKYLKNYQYLTLGLIFINFLSEEILPRITYKKIIVFIDEIQSLRSWNLQEEFLACIRSISDNVSNNVLHKLSFVLIGVSKPSDLVIGKGAKLNIGIQIKLDYLGKDCIPLRDGLREISNNCERTFSRIYYWTNGQPFLTQHLCYELTKRRQFIPDLNHEFYIDSIVKKNLLEQWRTEDPQSHFREIENSFLRYDENIQTALKMLSEYELIVQGSSICWKYDSELHADLIISGIVIKINDHQVEILKISNPIYQYIFNRNWIDETRRQLVAGRIPIAKLIKNIGQKSNISLIADCLDILRAGLYPFIEFRMIEYFGLKWQDILESQRVFSQPTNSDHLTCQHLLEILLSDRCWREVFEVVNLDEQVKVWVSELLKNYTHQEIGAVCSDINICSLLDFILSLLQVIGARSEAELVEQLLTNKSSQVTNNDSQLENYDSSSNQISVLSSKQLQDFSSSSTVMSNLINPIDIEITNHTEAISSMSSMSRDQQIANIIEKRKPQVDKVRRAQKNLNNLLSILDGIESCRERTLQRAEDPSIKGKLSDLHFGSVREKVRNCQDILFRLESRFSRDTLTIAFVGRAGQGKSRLIQSITGLSKAEVPDGSVDNCTGVKCTICHTVTDMPYGEVYFHTKASFLEENIHPYYEVLNLGSKPTSLSDFISNPLPTLNNDGAEARSYYDFLVKCHSNYLSFEHLLEDDSPKRISKDEIRQYVAQTDENNQRSYFNYLAVREVKIFCAFPNGDVGKIALIDLPGLGDTVLGDRDRIRRSLGHDVDFALFVYMPQGTRILQEEHYKLYDTANDALVELPIAKWSFMTLNQVVSSNIEGIASNVGLCNEIKQRIETQGRIRVLKCQIADCTDKNAATGVLDQVLDELERNLINLDNEYSQVGNVAIKNLQAELKLFFEHSKHAFAIAPTDESDVRKFSKLFKLLQAEITENLFRFLQEICPTNLAASENEKDTDIFQGIIQSIIKNCYDDSGIPSAAQIFDKQFTFGAGQFPAIFASELDHSRINIRRHFTSADNGLKDYVDSIKVRVAECFTNTSLGNLTPSRGIEFLKFFAEEIPSSDKQLKEAFHTLYSFEMTYRRNFQYRILKALEDLNPNTSAHLLSTNGKSVGEICKSMEDILETLHRGAICACREALEGFEGEPSLAVYAEVEVFIDQIVRSDIAKDCWEDFLRERSSQVWLEEFGQQVKEEKKEWLQLIDNAIAANKFDLI